MPIHAATIPSPLGPLRLVATERGLRRLTFDADRWPVEPPAPDVAEQVVPDDHPVLADVAGRLRAYFEGHAEPFDVVLDLTGLTAFQREVVEAMRAIPHATLATYGKLADDLGRPGGSRAVGRACNTNPVPIVVPCHRVVAADGSLGGYAAGTEVKRHLLELERGAMVPLGGWEPRAARERQARDTPTLF
jgi:O-6-methylguanine DNA methyltransferase